jgi:hemoglobin
MKILRVSALLVSLAAAACGGGSKTSGGGTTTPPAGEQKPLYDRLGGKEAITAVVDDFLANVVADTRINARFANADAARLRQMLIDQICNATGGPCEYTGKNMIEAHTGMGITEDEFNALVEDLVKSLDKFQVGETEKNELLTALGGMKGEIVGR